MAPKGQKQPERSKPGAWVGGEYAQPGAIFYRLTPEEQRRLKRWLWEKAREDEAYIRGLLLR